MSNFKVSYGKIDYKVILGKFPYHSTAPYQGQLMPNFNDMNKPIHMYQKYIDMAKVDAPVVPITINVPPGQPDGKSEPPINMKVSMAENFYTTVQKALLIMAQRLLDKFTSNYVEPNLKEVYQTHIHMVTKSCTLLPEDMKNKFAQFTGGTFINYPEEKHERCYFVLPQATNIGYLMRRSLTDYAMKENHEFLLTNIEPHKLVRDAKGFKFNVEKEVDKRWVIEDNAMDTLTDSNNSGSSSSSSSSNNNNKNETQKQTIYEGRYENSDARDAFILQLNRKTMQAFLIPVKECFKFSKINKKSEGKTLSDLNNLMKEESRKQGENFAKIRKTQLVKDGKKIASTSNKPSKLGRITSLSRNTSGNGGNKFSSKFDKLAQQEKVSFNTAIHSKSKNRFTNLLKKRRADRAGNGRVGGPGSFMNGGSANVGGGGSGFRGGSSRIGGFGSSGNNRYKGDFDSDGDDGNYSDDEDTGYMLLGNAAQIDAINAEGGDQDEARSDNDGLSGGEDVIENKEENDEIENLLSDDDLDSDMDLDEDNYEQQTKLQMEGGIKNATDLFGIDGNDYNNENSDEDDDLFGDNEDDEDEEIDVESFLEETKKLEETLLATNAAPVVPPASTLNDASIAKTTAAAIVANGNGNNNNSINKKSQKRKLDDIESNDNNNNNNNNNNDNNKPKKRRKITKKKLSKENMIRILKENGGKMIFTEFITCFINVKKKKALFKKLREEVADIEKTRKPYFVVLKREYLS